MGDTAAMPASATEGALDPRARVEAHQWYHTIELAPGLSTPGWFDTRATVDKVPMPASLAGRRCLDVGTWDGFWAFEMERRDADHVTAIDILDEERWDWPPEARLAKLRKGGDRLKEFKESGAAFKVAHEIIGSKVERVDLSVYDLSPETVGTFDFAFLGSLLLHLRDPVRALDALRTVVTGEAVIADTVDAIPSILRPRTPSVRLEGVTRPWWWIPNRAAFHQMVRSAGWEILETTGLYILPTGPAHPRTPWKLLPRKLLTAQQREEIIVALKGIPHTAVRVRPITP